MAFLVLTSTYRIKKSVCSTIKPINKRSTESSMYGVQFCDVPRLCSCVVHRLAKFSHLTIDLVWLEYPPEIIHDPRCPYPRLL